jgi:hypothetical protein
MIGLDRSMDIALRFRYESRLAMGRVTVMDSNWE